MCGEKGQVGTDRALDQLGLNASVTIFAAG
jgi:hypothetical protein